MKKNDVKRALSFNVKNCWADNKTMINNYKAAPKKTKFKVLAVILAVITGNCVIGALNARKSPATQAGTQALSLASGLACRVFAYNELIVKGGKR